MYLKKKLIYTLCTFIILTILYMMILKTNRGELQLLNTNPSTFACYLNPGNISTLEDVLKVKVNKSRSIFFLETSCASRHAGKVVLNARQACSIESAARMNPGFEVHVLMASPADITIDDDERTKYIGALLNYTNVQFHHVNIQNYFLSTPVQELYKTGLMEFSKWPTVHLSDVMRFVTLWRYGALYLDLDVLVLKSLEDLAGRNLAGMESENKVAAGVLQFQHGEKGHEWVETILRDVNENYKPEIWSYNCNGAMQRFLYKLCNASELSPALTPEQCQGFQLFPPSAFYPIHWSRWEEYFEERYLNSTLEQIRHSRVVHVWNKKNADEVVRLGSHSAYEHIARSACPNIFQLLDIQF